MDHADPHQSKVERRPIRRVRSPSIPSASISHYYKPKFGGRFYRAGNDHSFYKPGSSSNQNSYHLHPWSNLHRRDHIRPKFHHISQRERSREGERERFDASSPPKQNNTAFLPRSTSSRDKDMQFIVDRSDKIQSREREHGGTKSKERERSREGDLPSAASQAMARARDRAIQQKRREIDEVYYQECEMFGLVAKMLIAKDQSLERSIQSPLQENLRDIGKRCVEAMEKFIEDYDSRELSH